MHAGPRAYRRCSHLVSWPHERGPTVDYLPTPHLLSALLRPVKCTAREPFFRDTTILILLQVLILPRPYYQLSILMLHTDFSVC